jgi:D-beta-D-heptose 7-phosphate kinase/D-beta-D-heptose 1-phosphate adenosyltransferase
MNIIWVNGSFDCLHLGHLELLQFAHERGDLLYIGIESDVRIRHNKGSNRPIQDEETRKTILESFWFVDKVVIYDTDYQLECLIKDFKPTEMVFGENKRGKEIIGSIFCNKITYFPLINGYSTTKIVEKMSSSL